jgi:hypothetical protein
MISKGSGDDLRMRAHRAMAGSIIPGRELVESDAGAGCARSAA